MEENNEEKKVNAESKKENKIDTKEEKNNNVKEEVKKEEKSNQNTENNENIQKDDTKFKKVEVVNKKEEQKGSKVKKHTILKAILIIIGILVIAYLIFVIRNYYILKDILVKAGAYENVENYSYTTKITDEGSEIDFSCIKSDNVIRVDMNNKTKPEKSMIVWKDYNTNEGIIAFTGVNKAIKSEADKTLNIIANFPFQFVQINDAMSGLGLISLMYSDQVNEKNCYVIQLGSDYKIWVEKDTGLVIKQESKDGYVTECTGIEVNNVSEIYKPDLTGYEILK